MAGNIVEFYIKNFMRNGSLVTTETRLQTIPIYGEPVIDNPNVDNELGKAGSFEFEIEPVNSFYSAYRQLKTIMRVTYFGHTIFRGRVLTIDKTMKCRRTIHCEGDFAFLLDSNQPGTKEESRPEIGVLEYLQQIIAKHNADMHGDTDKMFTLGEVPGQYTSATPSEQRVEIPADKATQKFGDTSYNTSMDRIEGLLSDFGGYFRTRYDSVNNITYLDWYSNYYNASINAQTIELAKNLIDISGPTEVENLFTAVIPIGKNKNGEEVFISDYWPIVSANHEKVNYITVPELATIPLYSDSELNANYHRKTDYQDAINRFGWIWKPVTFENADTPEKLFTYAKDWMKKNYMPELTQWSVGALDMKVVNPSSSCILCGDRVNLQHPETAREFKGLTIISAKYQLYDPKNNKYVIGIPHQEVNAAYGTKAKGGKGGSGGGISKKPPPDGDDPTLQQRKLALEHDYYLKTECGRDITLDNPLAFTVYNTDVTQKDKKESLQDLMGVMSDLSFTLKTKWSQLKQESVRRGVEINDTQLLIDFTPSIKQRQTRFKNQTSSHMVNDVGLTHQQANVLLNETASQSYLASLVDQNGNWTSYAISQGANIWANSADLKQQAINTKTLLNGGNLPNTAIDQASTAFNQFNELLAGSSLNIDNLIDTDKVVDNVSGAVTKVVNFLDNDIKLENIIPDPSTGNSGGSKAMFGKGTGNNWNVKINELVTYLDEQGISRTENGFVVAEDVQIPSFDSLKTKLLVVDTLVANKANIIDLEAVEARVQTLEADALTANKIASMTLAVTGLNAATITSGGIILQNFQLRGNSGTWVTLNYVSSLSLSLTGSHKFEDADSGQIITGKLVTAFSKQEGSAYVLAGVNPT